MQKFSKVILYLFGIWLTSLLILNEFNKTNPIYLYTLAYPLQYLRASLKVPDLKPYWEKITKNRGDCRIQNTIAAIKNPDLYIVFGKVYDPKTKAGGDHQWTTSNPENPSLYEYITDNTTGLTEEKKKRAYYMPQVVYKLDVEKCKLTPVKRFKELTDEEEFLVKSGEFYVETFCKKYKEKWM